MVAEKTRADEQVANTLRDAILAGEFPAGTDLPGERELSARLGVSRLTLRAAVARLEGEGLLRPVHGSGTRVLDYRQTGGVELIAHLVALGATTGDAVPLLAGLLELRRLLAIEAIGLAAERSTDDERVGLRALVLRQSKLVDDPPAYVSADLALARALAAASHNTALVLVANTLTRMLERQPGVAAAFMADTAGTLSFYGRVLDLIEQGDGGAARRFARVLIERLDRQIIDRLGGAPGYGATRAEREAS